VLIDCGLLQGYKQLRLRNWASPPFAADSLDAVLLTMHIWITRVTCRCGTQRLRWPGVLHGSNARSVPHPAARQRRIQEEDAEYANRHGYSRHHPALPLYTEADALRALDQLEARPTLQDFESCAGTDEPAPPDEHRLSHEECEAMTCAGRRQRGRLHRLGWGDRTEPGRRRADSDRTSAGLRQRRATGGVADLEKNCGRLHPSAD